MSDHWLLLLAEYWLYAGALVAVAFLVVGIDRIDEDARGAYIFRPLLVPGVLLIWPLVLWRWYLLETGRDAWPLRHRPERRVHTRIAVLLAIGLPLIVIVALGLRQTWPADVAPQQIEAGQIGAGQ